MSILDRYPDLNDATATRYDFESCWTANNRSAPYSEQDVVAAMLVTTGNYSRMAMLLNRSRAGVVRYCQGNKDVMDLRAEVREGFLDEVEDQHMKSALAGDKDARKYFLSTLGKNRGYTVRVESTGKDGEPIAVDVSAEKEEFMRRLGRLAKAHGIVEGEGEAEGAEPETN